ncbi:hypothetical protein [Algoriphagus boritolerans]|uniref:Uncharacterized protein n=1 Tax=Algoriphagus boritolerans DSM 17298 = JCM 18970 TaxID=1120964 RepID=A0A1H5SZC8_9BACT|nr:hypothetical protein [Algoriphagus boritolerans]SEF55865.1 hypothetical protein SAMN03080598_00600 [Algoriphagus boritolerans DSM 17298 = JCM 18970]
MKKVLIGLAFLGSLAFSSTNTKAQGMAGDGSVGVSIVRLKS